MWDNPIVLRRLADTLISLTEQGNLIWKEAPDDEPGLLKTFFPDGMVQLIPQTDGRPPADLVVFGRWHEPIGTLRSDAADDVALIDRLYRASNAVKIDDEVDYWPLIKGKKTPKLEDIHHDIAKELAQGTTGARGRH